MKTQADAISFGAYIVLLLCFVAAGAALVFRSWSTPSRSSGEKRDPTSLIGLALQTLSYAIILLTQRTRFTPIMPLSFPLELWLAVITALLALGSAWMVVSAVRALGKHWSITARLVEDHRLVKEGPYRLVRHPIYTAMFGFLLATGLVAGRWIALPPAILVYAIGTAIRVRSEEKLLQEAFGSEFEDYARRVPAIIPRLR